MVRARSLVPLRTTPELPAEPAPPPAPPGVVNPPEWPDTRHVSHDYPDVMGIDVVAGRGFDEGDGPGRQVLLINRTLERSGLLGPDPVGRHVYALGLRPWEVVGVIEDVHQSGLDHDPGPQVFIDLRHLPYAAALIIENLNGSGEHYSHNVKRWRGGQMIHRWVASALVQAEKHFRRVRGLPRSAAPRRYPGRAGTARQRGC